MPYDPSIDHIAICKRCGRTYGEHYGMDCPTGIKDGFTLEEVEKAIPQPTNWREVCPYDCYGRKAHEAWLKQKDKKQ